MPSADNKRLAKNTLFLYFRMFLVMGVSLFTSRVILNALGVNDFGIYNVVGGMVALFSIISVSLAGSISRFITYELGTGDTEKLKQIFSTSIIIQFAISVIIILFASPLAFWFLNHKMDIAPERMLSANWVLGFSILTFIIGLISVPYNACIIAHEKMKAFAYVGVVEVLLKLGVAYLIYAFSQDRLILYAFLIFCISLIIRLIYGIYCSRHFEECHTKLHFNKPIFKEMSSFAGWNIFGGVSGVLQNQGTNVILNTFYGTSINAAYGIGIQVNSAVSSLSQNFMTALNPQITKMYAQKKNEQLLQLIYSGSRFSFFLLWIPSLIILLNTSYILKLWLSEVPAYTSGFVNLFIIYSLSENIAQPLSIAQASTGKIKYFQICVGGIRLLVLPLVYWFLKLGLSPLSSLCIIIGISLCMLLMKIFFLKHDIKLNVRTFFSNVILRVTIIISLTSFLSYISIFKLPNDFGFFIIKTIIIIIISCIIIYYFGCTKTEKFLVKERINSFIVKIKYGF